MILDLQYNYCFIHIPRTGGKLITQTLLPYLTIHGFLGGGVLRHLAASLVPDRLGLDWETYDNLWTFTIYRPLLDVQESIKRLIDHDIQRVRVDPIWMTTVQPQWRRIIQTALDQDLDAAVDCLWKVNRWPEDEISWRRYWICRDDDVIVDTVYEYSRDGFSWIIKDILAHIKDDAVI